jgi:hypothetical protein
VKQIADMESQIRKLREEVEYYKQFVSVQVIINREKELQPARRGGIR